jgi:AcrR family transcriptional regulator
VAKSSTLRKPRAVRRAAIAGDTTTGELAHPDRRLTWKYHTKQQAIIGEVRALLIEDGYSSLSLRRVAERCQMRLGNLQYYFPSRESLIVAFVRQWVRVETEQRERLKAKRLAPKQLAARWVDDLFEYLIGNEHGALMVELWAMASHDTTAREELDAWYAEERAYYGAALSEVNPGLSPREAGCRVRLMVGIVEGLIPQLNRARIDSAELLALRRLARESALRLINGD